jgi:protein tyrosine phosphatase (PTP) superfamily phosphohydrolase (DUF442 family)
MENNLSQIQDFLQISNGLGTSGQPRREQFALIQEAGYQVVINLATSASWDVVDDEPQIVRALGMQHHAIPVDWGAPTMEDLQRFCDLMDSLQGQRVFVHCARNMRVSAFVFLYRVKRRGEPLEACRATMEEIWQPEGVWEELVEQALANKEI